MNTSASWPPEWLSSRRPCLVWALIFLWLLVGLSLTAAPAVRAVKTLRSPKESNITRPSTTPPRAPGVVEQTKSASKSGELLPRAQQLRNVPPNAKPFNAREVAPVPLGELLGSNPTNSLPKEWLKPPVEPFTIGPGDVLEIELMGEPGRSRLLVCPDGKIYYQLLNGVEVWGLTLRQAGDLVEKGMSKYQLLPKPRVSVTVQSVGSKRIWLLGRVQAPGVYPLATPMTLLEALTMAGGPITSGDSDLASLQESFVMRQGQLLPVDFQRLLRLGDMSQNLYLQADDFIYMPSSFQQQVHLFGAVRQPGPVPFRHELTLLSAVASAGGARGGAFLSQVAIVRGSMTYPRVAIVDLGDIQKGKATDVLLEPRDIIFVPNSPYVTILSYVKNIVTTFVRTVAINEGVRAVVRGATAVSPVVTPAQ